MAAGGCEPTHTHLPATARIPIFSTNTHRTIALPMLSRAQRNVAPLVITYKYIARGHPGNWKLIISGAPGGRKLEIGK